MPSKMFYSTISAEILRICRATKSLENFKTDTSLFLKRMKNQGALEDGVKGSLKKLLERHKTTFRKYNSPMNQIIAFALDTFQN